jgi:hypothetical protein
VEVVLAAAAFVVLSVAVLSVAPLLVARRGSRRLNVSLRRRGRAFIEQA